MIRRYIAHPDYRNLAARTRADYDKRLEFLTEKIGALEPRMVERHHVIRWRDQWAEAKSSHEANYRLAVLKIIFEQAKNFGLLRKSDENPAKSVKAVRYEKRERQPWPQAKIDAFRSKATARTLLAFELLIGTGQRIADVLAMKWSDLEDGGIKVRQNKTGKVLWVPLTPHLRAALDAAERRSIFILTNERGSAPWSYRGAHQAVMKVRREIGAEDHDIHSLRYSAASELLILGADDDVIAAITGQSPEMVRHYTKGTRQKVRALKAKELRK